jgi:outer membrane protein
MNTKSPPFLRSVMLVACLVAAFGAGPATGEDLLQIYREAQKSDPALAAARAGWEATQERVPQARAGLLPNTALSGAANINNVDVNIRSDPGVNTNRSFNQGGLTFSASQPLYRPANMVALGQAKEQVTQADYTLAIAQQDLILRTAVAYFDVLLAEFNIELVQQQKIATLETLAQAKRNFEVGTATITDTNEAQARFDQINASEITFINELDRRRTALRAIIGRFPTNLKRIGKGFDPKPPNPNSLEYWVDIAIKGNLPVRFQEANVEIATLEVERARAGHLPTLDLVGSYGAQATSGSSSSSYSSDSRSALLGLQLNVPLYQGGFVNSRVREAIALLDRSRADLETTRRAAITNAQDGFSGVNNAVASVRAFEQAVISADVALQSNILGQEVGIRTNLDVLNVRQNVFQARRDVANAYFVYLLATLRLKAATGALTEIDLEELNRWLNG